MLVPGPASNVELDWEDPRFARFAERLAAFTRLVLFDKRGTGLSDAVAEVPTLEERSDDLRAGVAAAGGRHLNRPGRLRARGAPQLPGAGHTLELVWPQSRKGELGADDEVLDGL